MRYYITEISADKLKLEKYLDIDEVMKIGDALVKDFFEFNQFGFFHYLFLITV
ncbi:MAG: hypothetical protein ACI9U0_001381 [Flavobacteriales bacterium]|jgi:hypothetical protein|tara:strand:+ start:4138 stop:4296 length:159 start_codon:yes stop_codon:yes gene_type:complete